MTGTLERDPVTDSGDVEPVRLLGESVDALTDSTGIGTQIPRRRDETTTRLPDEVAEYRDPEASAVVRDVARRVPRRLVDGERADLVAVGEWDDLVLRGSVEATEEPLCGPFRDGERRSLSAGNQRCVGLSDVDRDVEAVESRQPPDVVNVVVSEEHAVEVVEDEPGFDDRVDHVARLPGHPRVDERQVTVVVDEVGVDPAQVDPPDAVAQSCYHVVTFERRTDKPSSGRASPSGPTSAFTSGAVAGSAMRADDVPPVHDRVAEAAREHFDGDDTGHDMPHAWRVYRLGRRLAERENADFTVVGAAALVHDLHRLRGEGFTHPRETLPEVRGLLSAAEFPEARRESVCHCVAHHEEYDFAETTDLDHEPTPEERVLRDADNLDALGAVGIGRAFTFGARHGQGMYDTERGVRDTYDRSDRDNTVIQHAREKLLRLPDAMETEAGRELATERAAFVETFVERFEAEWHGDR